ncbi:hypothetical protein ES702_01589 [subsurface metagenome]
MNIGLRLDSHDWYRGVALAEVCIVRASKVRRQHAGHSTSPLIIVLVEIKETRVNIHLAKHCSHSEGLLVGYQERDTFEYHITAYLFLVVQLFIFIFSIVGPRRIRMFILAVTLFPIMRMIA